MKRLGILILATLMMGCNAATHVTSTQPQLSPMPYEPSSWTVAVPPIPNLTSTGFTTPVMFLGSGIGEPGEVLTIADCSNDFTIYGLTAAAAAGVACGLGTDGPDEPENPQAPAGQPVVQLLLSNSITNPWVRGEAQQFWVVVLIPNSTGDQQYIWGGLLTEQFDAEGNVELAGPLTCLGGGGLCTVGDTVTGITITP